MINRPDEDWYALAIYCREPQPTRKIASFMKMNITSVKWCIFKLRELGYVVDMTQKGRVHFYAVKWSKEP